MTLIELMIIVAIVAVLTTIAVPKYADLLEKANLGATIGNLSSLRSSISIYHANYSVLPSTLDPAALHDIQFVMRGEVPFVKARYPLGPNSPYGNSITLGSGGPLVSGAGWFYEPDTGKICINSLETDAKGSQYSLY